MRTHEERMQFLEPDPNLDIQDAIKRATSPIHSINSKIEKGTFIIVEGKVIEVEKVEECRFGSEVFTKVWFIRPSDNKLVYNLPEFIKIA